MPIYTLERTQAVAMPLDECWRFFSDPRNLARITPPSLAFRVRSELPEEVHAGLMIRYTVAFELANAALNRKANGVTNNTLLLTKGTADRWEIAAIEEARVRHAAKARRRSSKARSGDPMARTMRKVGRSVRKIFR